jgi:hypothetical protein
MSDIPRVGVAGCGLMGMGIMESAPEPGWASWARSITRP